METMGPTDVAAWPLAYEEREKALPPTPMSQPVGRKPSVPRKPLPVEKPPHAAYSLRQSSLPTPQVVLSEDNEDAFRSNGHSRTPSWDLGLPETISTQRAGAFTPETISTQRAGAFTPETIAAQRAGAFTPPTQTGPLRHGDVRQVSNHIPRSEVAEISVVDDGHQELMGKFATINLEDSPAQDEQLEEAYRPLQYHHQPFDDSPQQAARATGAFSSSHSHSASSQMEFGNRSSELQVPRSDVRRPNSMMAPGSERPRERTHSPHLSVGGSISPSGSPVNGRRQRTPDSRPTSYVDLLNVPYRQQVAPAPNMDNALLRNAVGTNASLLDTRKTLEMYRANVKKTNDSAIQYEFAVFMIQASRDSETAEERADVLRESRQILQRLADRGYPFAQYYLGDGYASGLFSKGKEDWERAFPLFVSASKHGHAEAGYRAALCYEFGWGSRKDYAKAVQFYRASASKNHPGAAARLGRACLTGDMGLANRSREGMRWLKRAAESADFQYNSAPYELGVLHETGYGDDVFKDEAYAAQLFTQSADLGHPEAGLRMGQAYEHGQLTCPKDPALSVHFYNGAAQAGLPEAMMALCAWYFVGAEPVLEKDENEAYEWANRAAEAGYAKAQYAVGYFTEMGIGCRRDPLEANVWYVRAADQGDEKARQRLAIIRDAAAGGIVGKRPEDEAQTAQQKRGLWSKLMN